MNFFSSLFFSSYFYFSSSTSVLECIALFILHLFVSKIWCFLLFDFFFVLNIRLALSLSFTMNARDFKSKSFVALESKLLFCTIPNLPWDLNVYYFECICTVSICFVHMFFNVNNGLKYQRMPTNEQFFFFWPRLFQSFLYFFFSLSHSSFASLFVNKSAIKSTTTITTVTEQNQSLKIKANSKDNIYLLLFVVVQLLLFLFVYG